MRESGQTVKLSSITYYLLIVYDIHMTLFSKTYITIKWYGCRKINDKFIINHQISGRLFFVRNH